MSHNHVFLINNYMLEYRHTCTHICIICMCIYSYVVFMIMCVCNFLQRGILKGCVLLFSYNISTQTIMNTNGNCYIHSKWIPLVK